MTYLATLGLYSTCCSKVSTETPSQWVSNLVHLVTQLMSTVGVSWGRASSSCQVERFGSFPIPPIEKSHRSRGVCGVGPAESTGKPRSRYCPGGSRPATSSGWRRPWKAREINPSLMFCRSIPYNIYMSLPCASPSSCIMHHHSHYFKELGIIKAFPIPLLSLQRV